MAQSTDKQKTKKVLLVLRRIGFAVLAVIVFLLMLNSLLSVFVEHYYPTYGKYRLFAIVSDSMEPEIATGNMIVGRVPESEDEIEVGTVITFEATYNGVTALLTHRVIAVGANSDGQTIYTTRGDNAEGVDAYRPKFSDVVGIYTGRQCGFFGYFFGFLQSAEGAIALIIIALIIVITAIILHFVWLVNIWRSAAFSALQKSGVMLKGDKSEDMATIADVLGIVLKEPNDRRDLMRKDKKLNWFVRTGMLPQRPYSDDLDEFLAMLELQRRQKCENKDGATRRSDVYKWEQISLRAEAIAKRALEIKKRADELMKNAEKSAWEAISLKAGQLTERAMEILFKADKLCCNCPPEESGLIEVMSEAEKIASRTSEIQGIADEKICQTE